MVFGAGFMASRYGFFAGFRLVCLGSTALCLIASVQPALSQPPRTIEASQADRGRFSSERQEFTIPAGPLDQALRQWSEASKLKIFVPSALLAGKSTVGVTGHLTPESALRQLLVGTNLTFENAGPKTLSIFDPVPGYAAYAQAIALDTITVEGRRNQNAVLGNLPPPYAGGQVATGGQLGMLGNRSVMDTPFNQTNYTEKLIQDQQARSITDVLLNDPSVAAGLPRGANREQVIIRGFVTSNAEFGINGLYGLVGNQGSFGGLDAVERVELLKGPSALLNGDVGRVGGSVNMITKRAGTEPLTQLTTSYVSRSHLGAHIDIGRRYGENKEFGIRYNGSYRNGDLPVDRQSEENGFSSLGLDYRGERVRLAADLIYRNGTVEPLMSRLFFPAGVPIPSPPKATNNWSSGFQKGENRIALAQGEIDLADNITAYGGVGWARNSIKGAAAGSGTPNLAGDFSTVFVGIHDNTMNFVGQAGVRATFDTGPVKHTVNFNASRMRTQVDRALAVDPTAFQQNIYNPVVLPIPSIGLPDPSKILIGAGTSYAIADTLSLLNERVQVTVGVRRQQVFSESFDMASGTSWGAYDSSVWSPAYAVVLKPLENVSLYANYIQALEEGLVVDTSFANAGEIFPPFQAKQKEVGVKVDFGRITATVSAFEITRPGTLTLPGALLPTLTANGEVRNRGIEVNTFGVLTEGVRLLGGVTFYDARQVKTQDGAFDGNKVPGVPDVQIALGGEWDTPFLKGFTLTGRVIHASDVFADNANTDLLPQYTRLDLGARYTFDAPWNGKPVTVRFTVENVFDKSRWVAHTSTGQVYLDAPRTFLASTTFNF